METVFEGFASPIDGVAMKVNQVTSMLPGVYQGCRVRCTGIYGRIGGMYMGVVDGIGDECCTLCGNMGGNGRGQKGEDEGSRQVMSKGQYARMGPESERYSTKVIHMH